MEKAIGINIRKIRELKGLTQEYMASQLSLTQRAYSKLESGETRLHWNRMTEIAKILEVDPVDMVSFDDSLVFHNCTQSGKFGDIIHNNFPKELKEQYESRIQHLEKEVTFLRDQLRKQ